MQSYFRMRLPRLFRRDPLDKEWLPSPYEQALLVLQPQRLDGVRALTPDGCLMALGLWLGCLGREFNPTRER